MPAASSSEATEFFQATNKLNILIDGDKLPYEFGDTEYWCSDDLESANVHTATDAPNMYYNLVEGKFTTTMLEHYEICDRDHHTATDAPNMLEEGKFTTTMLEHYEFCDRDYQYDYEASYWRPSRKKKELLVQLRKLGIRSIPQKELE